ncbi:MULTISPECIES: leucocin A/sakacin P family class II bacteriocin [Streptococcus]|jgi:bacteriocin ubericin-A|uniref:leucocin A/sakacin P family class II bacteriocin n=1 Tax=Streptococcus TaxID=1301 RepID=UPI000B28577A|nr:MULTISPECIES: leucocin A/sakacin P family class II bacteriocin [Streptococcus]
MATQTIENFKTLDFETLVSVEGGKVVYYGNGLYCDSNRGCWVDWSQTVNTIITNSTMNWLTGGNAGWNSGGIL